MNYQQCIEYFYSQLPMFQRTGAAALKIDLHNIIALCRELGNPHHNFPSVHVAGTNGKGSSVHLLAAVLQTAGYKTGLYTSPHLKDFRERIRVNGALISKENVVEFVRKYQRLIDLVKPSFFEMTVALAFQHFAREEVEIAIIEVGLGGRLDSTNIITPLVSLITNIGFDHNDLLGNTLDLIAREKAGIIKPGVPVVISERQPETEQVFLQRASECKSPITFAEDQYQAIVRNGSIMSFDILDSGVLKYSELSLQLKGLFQAKNLPGVLQTLDRLGQMNYTIAEKHLRSGFNQVVDLTGIKGRWHILGENPTVICDTGHNKAALECTISELCNLNQGRLHMILGFVNDKDIRGMMEILPRNALYYFCSAAVPRSLQASELYDIAKTYHLTGRVVRDPNQALTCARQSAEKDDTIFIGGSTFVVAELNELI